MTTQSPEPTSPVQAGQPTQQAQAPGDHSQTPDDVVLEKLWRRVQGYIDAKEAKLGQAQGTPPPASQASTTPPAQAAQPPAAPTTSTKFANVDQRAEQLARAAGVELLDNDPEAAMLKGYRNEDEYLDLYAQAIQAKRQRANPPSQTPTNAISGAAAGETLETLTEQLQAINALPISRQDTKKRREIMAKMEAATKR